MQLPVVPPFEPMLDSLPADVVDCCRVALLLLPDPEAE